MLNTGIHSESTPRFFFNRITEITPEILKQNGIKACAVDLDNTLVYDLSSKLLPGSQQWLSSMKCAGIPVVILSNTGKKRAEKIARKLGNLPCIGNADKPDKAGYLQACAITGVRMHELAMIGDQLFTDIQGANKAGAVSFRVHWVRRERFGAIRFRLLRLKEARYLKYAGHGDKI